MSESTKEETCQTLAIDSFGTAARDSVWLDATGHEVIVDHHRYGHVIMRASEEVKAGQMLIPNDDGTVRPVNIGPPKVPGMHHDDTLARYDEDPWVCYHCGAKEPEGWAPTGMSLSPCCGKVNQWERESNRRRRARVQSAKEHLDTKPDPAAEYRKNLDYHRKRIAKRLGVRESYVTDEQAARSFEVECAEGEAGRVVGHYDATGLNDGFSYLIERYGMYAVSWNRTTEQSCVNLRHPLGVIDLWWNEPPTPATWVAQYEGSAFGFSELSELCDALDVMARQRVEGLR